VSKSKKAPSKSKHFFFLKKVNLDVKNQEFYAVSDRTKLVRKSVPKKVRPKKTFFLGI
jgi:hypothetical protein